MEVTNVEMVVVQVQIGTIMVETVHVHTKLEAEHFMY